MNEINLGIPFPPPDPSDLAIYHFVSHGVPVAIFFLNGTKLSGVIVNYNAGELVLREKGRNDQLVFRDKILTIAPSSAPQLTRLC